MLAWDIFIYFKQNRELKRKLHRQELENKYFRDENLVLKKQKETLEKDVDFLQVIRSLLL